MNLIVIEDGLNLFVIFHKVEWMNGLNVSVNYEFVEYCHRAMTQNGKPMMNAPLEKYELENNTPNKWKPKQKWPRKKKCLTK